MAIVHISTIIINHTDKIVIEIDDFLFVERDYVNLGIVQVACNSALLHIHMISEFFHGFSYSSN